MTNQNLIRKRALAYLQDVALIITVIFITSMGFAMIGGFFYWVRGEDFIYKYGYFLLGFFFLMGIVGILSVTLGFDFKLDKTFAGRFKQSLGQRVQGLKVEGDLQKVVKRWLIRYGLVGVAAILWGLGKSYPDWSLYFNAVIGIYIIYTGVDAYILYQNNGERTLTDKLVGTRVVEM
ncbi:RDD family protein [Bacillus sp. FJAT-27245]|uniref:RDD family protein n=1 Tax=Bacillus sp. FJAT-27245 TaxID=1684144 RepID=UPI0006A78BFF|nr:RDD family protein [Bacillus sp. FJAT-27245]